MKASAICTHWIPCHRHFTIAENDFRIQIWPGKQWSARWNPDIRIPTGTVEQQLECRFMCIVKEINSLSNPEYHAPYPWAQSPRYCCTLFPQKLGYAGKSIVTCFCSILDQGMKQGRFVLEEKVPGFLLVTWHSCKWFSQDAFWYYRWPKFTAARAFQQVFGIVVSAAFSHLSCITLLSLISFVIHPRGVIHKGIKVYLRNRLTNQYYAHSILHSDYGMLWWNIYD